MLLAFRVSNHRSLAAEQELLLSRKGAKSKDLRGPFEEAWNPAVNSVTGIYGANASGKSSLISAVRFLRRAVQDSFQRWAPDGGVPTEPFALLNNAEAISRFEIEMLIQGKRHQYGFEASKKEIVSEWLYTYPHGRRRVVFERVSGDADPFYFGDSLSKGSQTTGQDKLIAESTRPNSLFLSAAHAHNHKVLSGVADWISKNLRFAAPENAEFRLKYTLDAIREDPALKVSAAHFLRSADLGIDEISIKETPVSSEDLETTLRIMEAIDPNNFDPSKLSMEEIEHRRSFELLHSGSDGEAIALPFRNESTGTKSLLGLLGPIIDALRSGKSLFIDEIDTSLHPRLVREVVSLFKDHEINPKQAQLIFTSHDISILGHINVEQPLLERDQVWLTEKSPTGETRLYPLTDFSPRKLENLERGYLQGRYGAVPSLSEYDLRAFANSLEQTRG